MLSSQFYNQNSKFESRFKEGASVAMTRHVIFHNFNALLKTKTKITN